MHNETSVLELVGKTLTAIKATDKEIVFVAATGEEYLMYHKQDCCECVYVEDICGDLDDLVGVPILKAEELSDQDESELQEHSGSSHTWTFYQFATIKGYVTIRWFGSSNGYYSEEVSFFRTL